MRKFKYILPFILILTAGIFAFGTVCEEESAVKAADIDICNAAEEQEISGYLFRVKEGAVPSDREGIRYLGNSTYSAESKEDIYEAFQEDDVEYAEESFLLSMLSYSAVPDDKYYGTYQDNLRAMNVPYAWEQGVFGDKSVTVAVIDSGLAAGHEDIDYTHVLKGKSYVPGQSQITDGDGHGTFVSGIIMADQNNGKGIAGIVPDVCLLPLKVFDSRGNAYGDSVIEAVYDAVDKGADVINMSMGTTSYSKSFKDACDYAASKGCIIVAAAGNNGDTTKMYPAAFTNVIAVGSTDNEGNISSFSQRGNWIYVTAPGEAQTGLYKKGYIRNEEGTSFASPEVASLAAAAKSIDSDIDISGFKLLLRQTSDNTTSSRNTTYGYGRINFRNAVNVLLGNCTVLKDSDVTIEYDRIPYSGSARKPAVTVTCGGKTLRPSLDYTVDYTGNTEIGTGKTVVTGCGMYSGCITKEFVIYDTVVTAYANETEDGKYTVSKETAGDILSRLEEDCETVILADSLDIVLPVEFLDSISAYPLTVKGANGMISMDVKALSRLVSLAGAGNAEFRISGDNELAVTGSDGNVIDPSWIEDGQVKAGIVIPSELVQKRKCVKDSEGKLYTGRAEGKLFVFDIAGYDTFTVKNRDVEAKAAVKKMKVKMTASRIAGGIKASVKCDVSELVGLGYTVKYSYYRSTYRNSGYAARKLSSLSSVYKNTKSLTKGKRYYYRAKVKVYAGSSLVAQTGLSECIPASLKY